MDAFDRGDGYVHTVDLVKMDKKQIQGEKASVKTATHRWWGRYYRLTAVFNVV